MIFLFLFYKTPLVYAIRRRDVRAVRLLLDFDADINNYQGIPPLYIAAKAGFYEGVRMLRQKGAILDQNGDNALLASVESGSRECFTAMIEGQEHIILKKIRSHSLSYYAIELKSNLLPIIASITDKQCELQKGKMDADETEFPPNDIKKNDLKKFKTALDLQDQYLPYNEIKAETKRVKSIFSQISENSQDDETFVDLDDQQTQHNDNYNGNEYKVNNNNFNSYNENSLNSDDVSKSNNKTKKHSQKVDSSAFLPQIPLSSDSTKESYESANSGSHLQNSQNKQNNQTKKLTKIEEISIKNKKDFALSQNQLNNQQSLQDVFSSSDDLVNKDDDETEEEERYEKLKSKKDKNNNNIFTDDEEDIEYINEEEEDEFENEIEEEEEEIESELRNIQGENYEYETEYEYEVVTTDVITTQNK